MKEFEDLTRGLEAGDVIWMSIDFGGLTQELKIELDGPPEEPSE